MIGRFFHSFCVWWLSELKALVPKWICRFIPRGAELVGILRNNEFVLLEIRDDRELRLLCVSNAGSQFDPDFAKILCSLRERQCPVKMLLGSDLGLSKLLKLPIAAQNDLDQLLRFEMDRLSPFPVDEVYFAHQTLRVLQKERCLLVQIQIVPRITVERVVATCQCLGIQPKQLQLAGDVEDAALNLLPPDLIRRRPLNWIDCSLVFLAIVLGGFSAIAPLLQMEGAAAKLHGQIILEEEAAERSAELQHQLDTLTSTMGLILKRQRFQVLFTRVIAEATQFIPDDTYVTELWLNQEEIVIMGYAQSTSSVINSLGQSPFFWEARFLSPITRDERSGRERFHIALRLKAT